MFGKAKRLFYGGLGVLTRKTVDDEFVRWLTFANAGMLNPGNVYAMKHAVDRLPSTNPVIEIGSFCGLSTNVLAYLLGARANPLITCDRWAFENAVEKVGESEISHERYRAFVIETFERNVRFFSSHRLPHTIEAFSDEFFDVWRAGREATDVFGRSLTLGGPISFAYIDGNHTYSFARRDFENVDAYLEPGGFILFDDSSDADHFGLSRLMREVRKTGRYVFVMKNPNYLFQKLS